MLITNMSSSVYNYHLPGGPGGPKKIKFKVSLFH